MKLTTAANVVKVFGGLGILSGQGIIGVEAQRVSSIVCHLLSGGSLQLLQSMCSVHGNLTPHKPFSKMITISPTLLCFELVHTLVSPFCPLQIVSAL